MCFFSLDLHLLLQLLFGFILIWSFSCKHQCPLWLVYTESEFVKRYWRAHRISWRIRVRLGGQCSQEHYTDYTPGSSSGDPGMAATEPRSFCTYHQVSLCGGIPSLLPVQAGHLSAMLHPSPPCWIPHGASLCTPALSLLRMLAWVLLSGGAQVTCLYSRCKAVWGCTFLTSRKDVDLEGRKFLKCGRNDWKNAMPTK